MNQRNKVDTIVHVTAFILTAFFLICLIFPPFVWEFNAHNQFSTLAGFEQKVIQYEKYSDIIISNHNQFPLVAFEVDKDTKLETLEQSLNDQFQLGPYESIKLNIKLPQKCQLTIISDHKIIAVLNHRISKRAFKHSWEVSYKNIVHRLKIINAIPRIVDVHLNSIITYQGYNSKNAKHYHAINHKHSYQKNKIKTKWDYIESFFIFQQYIQAKTKVIVSHDNFKHLAATNRVYQNVQFERTQSSIQWYVCVFVLFPFIIWICVIILSICIFIHKKLIDLKDHEYEEVDDSESDIESDDIEIIDVEMMEQ